MNTGFSSKNDEQMNKEHTDVARHEINNSSIPYIEKLRKLAKLPVPPPPPKRGGKRKQRRTHKKRKSKTKSKSKSKSKTKSKSKKNSSKK